MEYSTIGIYLIIDNQQAIINAIIHFISKHRRVFTKHFLINFIDIQAKHFIFAMENSKKKSKSFIWCFFLFV